MAEFSPLITDFWQPSDASDGIAIVVDPDLAEDRRLTILATNMGTRATMTPVLAGLLDLRGGTSVTELLLREALADADISMRGADCLFYFTGEAKAALLAESPRSTARQLTEADADLFKAFEAAASEQDLDEAYVELDHWAVFGSLQDGKLAAAASAYPWRGSTLADIGVLTLPPYRGKGHGRAVVRALSRHAYAEGYEPQYRCQLDNHASRALAKKAGLTQFGTWEVIATA